MDEEQSSSNTEFPVYLKDTQHNVATVIVGAAVFVGVVVYERAKAGQQVQNTVLHYVAAAIAIAAIALSYFVPLLIERVRLKSIGRKPEPERSRLLVDLFRFEARLRMQFFFGAALLNGIAYLVRSEWWSLVLMLAQVGCLIVTFPTRARFDDWERVQREAIEFQS